MSRTPLDISCDFLISGRRAGQGAPETETRGDAAHSDSILIMESSVMDESKSMTATEEVGESFAQSSEDAGYFEGGLGANEVGAGPLFNDSVDGSELLGIGFEESDIHTNEILDDATSALIDQSSILQLNEDLDNLHDAYKASRTEVKDLNTRMKSRAQLIDKIRSAYLRDVVTIKHILNDVLSGKEKKMVMDEFVGRLPSVDLADYLDLYKPPNTKLRLKKCDQCGGHVDVIIKDSDHVERLMKVIEKYKEREEHMGVTIATQDAEAEINEKKRQAALREHRDEKNVLYKQLKKLNADLAVSNTENEKMKKATGGYRDEIRAQKAEIDRLLVKEQRLADLEVETNGLRMDLRNLTGDVSKQEDEVNGLRKDLDESQVKCRKLQETLDKSQALSRDLDAKIAVHKKEEKKLKDLNEFLEKNLEEKSVACVQLEGQVLELKEEKECLATDGAMELEAANKVTEGLTEENNKLESSLAEKKQSELSLQKALKAAEALISQKDSTIKSRELEMRALAAEVEALQEELAALKQFVSDTVANRRTPSRAHRETYSDEEEDEVENIWHVDDDSTLASENASLGGDGAGAGDNGETSAAARNASSDDVSEHSGIQIKGNSAAAIRQNMSKGLTFTESKEPIAPKEGRPMNEGAAPAHDTTQKHVKYDASASAVEQAHGHVVHKEKKEMSAEEMLSQGSPQPKMRKQVSIEEASGSVSSRTVESGGTPSRSTRRPKKEEDAEADDAEFHEEVALGTESKETKININAPTHSDVKSGKVAPPTVQANTKKKMRHDQRAVAETSIDLLGPTDNACAGELMIRDAVILALKPEMGSNPTKKAMNACRDIFADFGRLLTDSVEGVWSASLLSKRGLDLLVKTQTVSGSILSMNSLEMGDADAHNKLGSMVSDVVPLIGSDVGLKLSERWQGEISLHKAVAQLMIPTIDTNVPEGSPSSVVWETFDRFFGDKKRDYAAGLKEMRRAIGDMTDYFDRQNGLSNSTMVDMVKDWAEAKTIYYDLDNRLDQRAAQVKKDMMMEVEAVSRELGLANGRFDAAKTFSKKLEAKLETVTRRLNELEQLPPKISSLEAEIAMLRKSKEEQAALIMEKEQALSEAVEKDSGQSEVMMVIEKKVEDMQEALINSSAAAVKHEQAFIYENQQKEVAEGTIKTLVEKEKSRLAGMTDKSTDTALLMVDRGLQTDFMTYPMSLRTKLMAPLTKAQKGGGPKPRSFAVQLIDTPAYAQDIQFMSESAISHGSQHINSLPRSMKGMMSVQTRASGLTMEDTLLGGQGQGRTPAELVSNSPNASYALLDAGSSTISYETSMGTDDGGHNMGIGVTVRATTPQDIYGRGSRSEAGTNTAEFGNDITDRIMNQLQRTPSVPNSDSSAGMSRTTTAGRSVGPSTPLSYVLSDDVDDEYRDHADDVSVGSSHSHLSRLSYDTTAAFTLASSQASQVDESSANLSRFISSPITAKGGRSGEGRHSGTGSRSSRSQSNVIPPLQMRQQRTIDVTARNSSSKGKKSRAGTGSDTRYLDSYMDSAPAYDPRDSSLFAAKTNSLYVPDAAKQLSDLKKSFFNKKQ